MNNYIIIALFLLNFNTYLYAQEQKNGKQEDSPKSAALRKALKESEATGQEYLIKSSDDFTKRIIDRYSSHDNTRIQQLQRHGLKKEYDTLYSILLSGSVKKDTAIQSYYGKMLPPNARTQYSSEPESYRRIAWDITSAGYTLPLLEEFQQYGINVIDHYSYFNRKNPWQNLVLFSPMIIIGRIDSAYIDTSFHDDSFVSYNVSVKETLKGDTSIKKILVRRAEKSPSFGGNVKEEYLLFLYKNRYERISFLRSEQSSKKECIDCYEASEWSFIILPEYRLRDNPQLWREREQATQTVRNYCKEYAPIFNKMKRY